MGVVVVIKGHGAGVVVVVVVVVVTHGGVVVGSGLGSPFTGCDWPYKKVSYVSYVLFFDTDSVFHSMNFFGNSRAFYRYHLG